MLGDDGTGAAPGSRDRVWQRRRERESDIYIEREEEKARHRVAGRKALSSFAFLCRHLTYVPAFDLFGVVRECLCVTIYDARGTTLYCSQGAAPRLDFARKWEEDSEA